MAIIRGKYFTLTPTSKLDVFANPGKRLTLSGDFNPIAITGGSVSDVTVDNVTYRVHSFTATGILTVTTAGAAEYLVVAGGGGGASGRLSSAAPPISQIIHQSGGGGGAGGLLTGSFNLSVGTYDIVVGSGGNGGIYPENPGLSGNPTKLTLSPDGASLLESFGGGGGGINAAGLPGGSGGGGGSNNSPLFPSSATITNQPGGTGTVGQGNPGASGTTGSPSVLQQLGGGGGGAGGSSASVDGGLGLTSKFNSLSTTYSSGGGGGGQNTGVVNTGNGGGGGAPTGSGGNGGSGIVIIRYRI
jgi:hypothetical protein